LAGQRSEGFKHDVRVMDVRGVQSHLIAELVEPIEQAVSAPLQGRRSRPQDPEVGMIHSLSFRKFFILTSL
jgi:hypothetical protein